MNWNLTVIYKTNEDFLNELKDTHKYIDKAKSYEGKLNDEKEFVEYLLLQKEFEEKASKLYLYAHLSSDLNKKDVEKLGFVNSCMVLFNEFGQATSFEQPEFLSIGREKVMSFIDNNKEIEEFRFIFEKMFHSSTHILSQDEERIMSILSPSTSFGGNLYSMLAVADGENDEIDYKGKKQVVTQGNWSSLIEKSDDEEEQKRVFESIFKKYEKNKNTYATIYDSILEKDKDIMQARGYKSILEVHLFGNNIPTEVYENLVEVAGSNTEYIKKYFALRKEYLGLSEYHTYHRFKELATSTKEYTFDQAKELFFASIEKFPKDFQDKAHIALEEGYVDVYEKDGKRTGAYSSSVENFHPFILLNYQNTLDNVFTVAHESGHSMHSLYACESQPIMLQNYTIFVAEIASTFNEHNLLDYLMSSGKLTKDEQIMLLQKSIDDIISTFYRQTLFAEYELRASRLKEQNEAINYQVLSNIMIELYDKYYGIDITKEVFKQYVWAYIPHLFYTPFYVYQYATSFSASFKLYQNVKDNIPGAFERYTNLLKAGGSKYPTEIAKEAGVDFTKKETFEAVTNRLKELVIVLEELLKDE